MPSWLKGVLFALASGTLAVSDGLGIQHSTWAKTAAYAVLALVGGQTAMNTHSHEDGKQ